MPLVIYERRHSPHGCVRIHDDCIARTEADRASVLLEQQHAAYSALEVLIDQLGVEGVKQLLARACPDSPLREEVQRIRANYSASGGRDWTAPVVVV